MQAMYNIYDETRDPGRLLTPQQLEELKVNTLSDFPVWLVVVLHFLTLGLFTLIYHGLKFNRLPRAKHDDFGTGKAIGFMFIPFFNLYWVFRYVLNLTDRLNFQLRLRGEPPRVNRGLALASCIVYVIPYVGVISWLILMPIVSGQWQATANRIVTLRDHEMHGFAPPGEFMPPAPVQAPPPPPPPSTPPVESPPPAGDAS